MIKKLSRFGKKKRACASRKTDKYTLIKHGLLPTMEQNTRSQLTTHEIKKEGSRTHTRRLTAGSAASTATPEHKRRHASKQRTLGWQQRRSKLPVLGTPRVPEAPSSGRTLKSFCFHNGDIFDIASRLVILDHLQDRCAHSAVLRRRVRHETKTVTNVIQK